MGFPIGSRGIRPGLLAGLRYTELKSGGRTVATASAPFLQQVPQIKFLVGSGTAFVPASVR